MSEALFNYYHILLITKFKKAYEKTTCFDSSNITIMRCYR